MINRKQAAELLARVTHARNSQSVLEAVYSAADGPTKDVLSAHPDLRVKAHLTEEARVAALQSEQDYRNTLGHIRVALDSDLRKTGEEPRTEDSDLESSL